MASGFLNSAGTDLDSLFYTDNGNAGAIGFRVSGGQDLGDRYTDASTLGYNVGYKNSAGTDLGYLRGKLVKPSITVNVSTDKTVKKTSGYDSASESYWYTTTVTATINISVVDNNSFPMSKVTVAVTGETTTDYSPNSASFSTSRTKTFSNTWDAGWATATRTYTVTVTATNSAGSTTVTKSVTISSK